MQFQLGIRWIALRYHPGRVFEQELNLLLERATVTRRPTLQSRQGLVTKIPNMERFHTSSAMLLTTIVNPILNSDSFRSFDSGGHQIHPHAVPYSTS